MPEVTPIDSCFHPQLVKVAGDFLCVPCGDCLACRRNKQIRWSARLDHEIRSSVSTLFITLTYSNEHLPLAHLDPRDNTLSHISYTKFNRQGIPSRHELVFPYNSLEENSFKHIDNLDIPHYVIRRINNNPVFDDTNSFAVCLRKDIQDFNKRLRILLSRNPETRNRNHSYRYFICSEYGPETFRPHYHGLLFFDDELTASLCYSQLINQAWRKSSLNTHQLEKQCQFVSVGSSASSYTSKYVTKYDDLPLVLRHKLFKPFSVSSHSTPIGSSAIFPTLIGHTVRETDLLYTHEYQDKDTRELITKRVPYPTSLWSRYFPRFLCSGCLPLSIFSKCIARIFNLDFNQPIPNYTSILERKYGLNSFYHSTSQQLHYFSKQDNSPTDTALWFSIFNRLGLKHSSINKVAFGYSTNDDFRKITFSDIIPLMYNDNNDDDFIDLYLFGIPQNRTSVNKILQCRRSNLDFATDYYTYLNHFNLYHTKTFNNSLIKQYDTFMSHCNSQFFVQDIVEYYPSFFYSFPKQISAFDTIHYEKVANILYNGFNLFLEDFYDHNGLKIDFLTSIRNTPRYYYYRATVVNSHRKFLSKRKHYYEKYGCGEYLTTSAPPYPT